jgi:hypothetical protein
MGFGILSLFLGWRAVYKPALSPTRACVGACAKGIVGFAWGGWVTGSSAQKSAEELAQNTVVARLAPICVEQFNQDSEKDQKLEKLKETRNWERGDYVEKQGWATMPGENEADSKVAGKCAELLAELGQ